jgi:hypothetical protein
VRVGCRLIAAVLLMLVSRSDPVRAQDPVTIIKEGVTKIIKAVDLQIQRIQTQTIWLEEAQKVVENAMSSVDLDDIRSWVQAQKDLYGGYFQELWQVKSAISLYHKIAEIIARQEQIVASYKQAYGLLKQDGHFTAAEIQHMGDVYTGIINESLRDLDQLFLVINSFTTQMSDERRMAIINVAGAGMDKNYSDLTRFNNENELLSLGRASDANEIEFLKNLYGL